MRLNDIVRMPITCEEDALSRPFMTCQAGISGLDEHSYSRAVGDCTNQQFRYTNVQVNAFTGWLMIIGKIGFLLGLVGTNYYFFWGLLEKSSE